MKKMGKYFWFQLILLVCVASQFNAMENSNNICYFKLLPPEICNYIMLFVESWETKEVFIERTKKKQALPAAWVHYLGKNTGDSYWEDVPFYELSPDTTKIAIIKLFYEQSLRSTLVIVDNGKKKLYDGPFPYQLYRYIALAQSGNMVATIQKQERSPGEIIHDYKNILTIQKIVQENNNSLKMQEIKREILPDGFDPVHLAFNKQDTHLIVYGCKYEQNLRKKTYRMLRLEDQQKNPLNYDYLPLKEDKSNKLQEYFNYRMVCKNYLEEKK